jgi:hypothetical protein
MKIVLYDKKKDDKFKKTIDAMYHGLKEVGLDVSMNTSFGGQHDIAVCWGWRAGKREFSRKKNVLVMEHGYFIDRDEWISLGWNGLNNNATFLNEDVQSDRWEMHFREHMKPWKSDGKHILFCGQVPGDMSLKGRNLTEWYFITARQAEKTYKLPIVWRPHPKDKIGARIRLPNARTDQNKYLIDSLQNAAAVMAFNSNSLVDAVMNGVPAIAFDDGTMAWDLCAKNFGPIQRPDREDWGRRMAYTSWNHEEIASGIAIKHVFQDYLK